MKIKEIVSVLERRFPLCLQEDFDNCGVQCGDVQQEATGVLVCFEFSTKVLDEALAMNANLIISHHPLMLKRGICKIEPTNTTGDILCKAMTNRLTLYSMHTNIDSAEGGGNDAFAERLNLSDTSVLVPSSGLFRKVVVFVPQSHTGRLKNALAEVGCGIYGHYDRCSYRMQGTGSFRPLPDASPFIGEPLLDEEVAEDRLEMIFPANLQKKVIATIYSVHPYEEPAFDIIKLENPDRRNGLGRVGLLPKPMKTTDFLQYVKEKMRLKVVRWHGAPEQTIRKVAVCGGGGASFIEQAVAAGADAYVTGDVKYHDFFRANGKMLIADIGHYEGEFFIKEIIYKALKENFSTFAVAISKLDTLEIQYT